MRVRRRLLLVLAVPVALVVLVVGGTFVYIHFIQGDAPPRLTLDAGTSSSAASSGSAPSPASASGTPSGSVDGTWAVTGDSIVGYRVQETLFGQTAEAAGRTSAVKGTFAIAAATVTDASFTVDMTKVSSNDARRDNQFRGRIMDVARFPTGSFVLTGPIALPAVPAGSTAIEVTAAGDLTLHGTKRAVTFSLKAQRDGTAIKVNATIPIRFADYGIDNPSGGPASVGDKGELEVLLVLVKQ